MVLLVPSGKHECIERGQVETVFPERGGEGISGTSNGAET